MNEMNAAFSFARVFEVEGTVTIAMELFAEELTAAQIEYACGLITFAADHWDDELQRSFGGETFFEGDGTVAMPDPPTDADPTTREEPAAGNGAGYL